MREIKKGKIRKAMKKTNKIYSELGLDYTEIEIVTRCQNVAARVGIAKTQLDEETKAMIEQTRESKKTQILEWMPAVCSILAILIVLISFLK